MRKNLKMGSETTNILTLYFKQRSITLTYSANPIFHPKGTGEDCFLKKN
jgi:hypothetical protein